MGACFSHLLGAASLLPYGEAPGVESLFTVGFSCSFSEVAMASYERIGATKRLPTRGVTLPADALDILAEPLFESYELRCC